MITAGYSLYLSGVMTKVSFCCGPFAVQGQSPDFGMSGGRIIHVEQCTYKYIYTCGRIKLILNNTYLWAALQGLVGVQPWAVQMCFGQEACPNKQSLLDSWSNSVT